MVIVEDYIPNPMRCFNCQKYGHTFHKCNNKQACERCRQSHDTESCREEPQCTNCKGDHPSYSKKCPRFAEEKQVQKVRTAQKIPFSEASVPHEQNITLKVLKSTRCLLLVHIIELWDTFKDAGSCSSSQMN